MITTEAQQFLTGLSQRRNGELAKVPALPLGIVTLDELFEYLAQLPSAAIDPSVYRLVEGLAKPDAFSTVEDYERAVYLVARAWISLNDGDDGFAGFSTPENLRAAQQLWIRAIYPELGMDAEGVIDALNREEAEHSNHMGEAS